MTSKAPPEKTRQWMILLATLTVAAVAVVPYLLSRFQFPDERLDVSVMYRDPTGDCQYFPFVRAFASGRFGEFSIKEDAGAGVWSFPYLPLVVHGICFRLFGAYGFPVADALVAVAYLHVLLMFFRTAGMSLAVSLPLSTLIAAGHNPTLSVGMSGIREIPLVGELWGRRFPRPYVSEVVVLLCLWLITDIVVRFGRAPLRLKWALCGASLAAVIQVDVHSAITLALLASAVGVVQLATKTRETALCLAGALTTFLLCLTPFVAARVLEHPDVPIRFGTFPINRLMPIFDARNIAKAAIPTIVLLGTGFAVQLLTPSGNAPTAVTLERITRMRRLLALFLGVIVITRLAMPISMVLLGKGIQLYHFLDRQRVFDNYVLTTIFATLVTSLLRLGNSPRNKWAAMRLPGTMGVVCAGVLALTVAWN